jgi:type III restriction enzyme
MDDFFSSPILNSPYDYPTSYWELDGDGQPTHRTVEGRRPAKFVTPIPKPKKSKKSKQSDLVLDEGHGLSTEEQQYDPTSVIIKIRDYVDKWRLIPDPNQWRVTPETARLLEYWRHHKFSGIRPFFCQVEAVETAIWFDVS